ncbi:hypothetical protein ETB97_001481 [Aspergillus alliaceus]|uniref:Uncharacterized protein n=1 Tax=Petromyces alliaceus TaxID=209559 RepID=A0A5N6FRU6_PETAA|nr:uncharacterized protein BDW43DRAFT_313024 [Aspergillus alliaceus]KAB8231504.1 hypothetical protein BDW43DRAFT_313024 [Aspergillus alliaceus]KAF5860471.1 hypothetical protein ETB97_001481 [Aspergillus burnettii]
MSDPYTQHPHYTSPVPGADASVYTPADSSYQNPPYDYDPQHPYGQQYPPSQNYQYVSHYDLTQTPKSHPPQASGPDLSPTAEFQQVGRQQGSNADYYTILRTPKPKNLPVLPTKRGMNAALQELLSAEQEATIWDTKRNMVFWEPWAARYWGTSLETRWRTRQKMITMITIMAVIIVTSTAIATTAIVIIVIVIAIAIIAITAATLGMVAIAAATDMEGVFMLRGAISRKS